MKTIILGLFIGLFFAGNISAHAEIFCREYSASGDLNLTQICAEKDSSGTFHNPELLATSGIHWQISKGFFPKKRANQTCHALGAGDAISYQTGMCLQEKAAVNMKGNYRSSAFFMYGTGDCIKKLECQ